MGESDWSRLLPDLLAMISRKLQLVEDFTAFRGVCTSWRAAADADTFSKSWPKVPLLMLAEQEDSDDREFYSLSKSRIWRAVPLPESKGKKCIESRGWLITIAGSGDMGLLHPFSRRQIQLPNLNTFCRYTEQNYPYPQYFVSRAVLSASPSDTSEFVLVILGISVDSLGFWRPGEKSWTAVESSHAGAFIDVNFYNGKYYAITYFGEILYGDVSHPGVAHFGFTIDQTLINFGVASLVESGRELLIVAGEGDAADDYDEETFETYETESFQVIQLDLINKGWKKIKNVRQNAIFVGLNGAFSMDATGSSDAIKPNCIYFTDAAVEAYSSTQRGKDMGIYHLEGGRIDRFGSVQSFSLITPPLWVAPSF